jgi:L-fuconate dehydratase
VVLETDHPRGFEGHGLTFTTGRGTEVCVAAERALAHHVVGRTMEDLVADLAGFWRSLVADTQVRWLGPEKGVVHLATAAIVNAVWDLYAKLEGKPLWKLLADLTPEQLVAAIDFRYIDDDLSPDQALAILRRNAGTRPEREAEMLRDGFPAYTTSAGWMGYPEEKITILAREAVEAGFDHLKLKVGLDAEGDRRRAGILRAAIGPRRRLMVDANQVWGVEEAIQRTLGLRDFDPWWVEEPTNPDDLVGHQKIRAAVRPIGLATGEHVHNRVMFKQLFQLQAIDFCQVDSCRLGGVNEVLAVLLLAAKHGVPVCPHAGGVGLCEYVQHLAIFDYIAVGASLENRVCEYVDHLHEHFLDPVRVVRARYQAPVAPGYSIEMRPESLAAYAFPGGSAWTEEVAAV